MELWHVDMEQISDTATIEAMVEKILADNTKQVEAYRGGKTKLQGFFVGQVDVFLNYKLNNFSWQENWIIDATNNVACSN